MDKSFPSPIAEEEEEGEDDPETEREAPEEDNSNQQEKTGDKLLESAEGSEKEGGITPEY